MRLPLWLPSLRRHARSSNRRPRRQAGPPLVRPRLEALEGRWLPSTFLVRNANDAGAGSLRQAILDANATPGTNEIDFAIGNGGAQVIRPTTALPVVNRSVVIDSTTQPGFAGSPLIDLDGADVTPGTDGLIIRADGCTIKGLAITGFLIHDDIDPDYTTVGLRIYSSRNVVQGNYFGTDLTGTLRKGNGTGVAIESGSNNLIGGTTAGAGNLISGNGYGLIIHSSFNVVQGNFIGTDVTGTAPLGNVYALTITGSNNLIGGTTAEARNLISSNGIQGTIGYGIEIFFGGTNNRVQGNYIGTDVTGTSALGNTYGVYINGGTNNLIGGTTSGAGNLISGNQHAGLYLGGGADQVQGNYIGTDVTGTQALGNESGVVLVVGHILLGGTEAGAGNLISGNSSFGVVASGGNNRW
jgi:hypothetical protein